MGENELINELINREQQVNEENQKNLNTAKGLVKGIYSGEILPTLNNLWRMASSAYKYYIAPKTPYIEGTPPTVGISSPTNLEKAFKFEKALSNIKQGMIKGTSPTRAIDYTSRAVSQPVIQEGVGLRIVRPTNPTFTNQITNQAEMNAYKDYQEYLKELKRAGSPIPEQVVPSNIPTGRLPYGENTRYPKSILDQFKTTPAAPAKTSVQGTTKIQDRKEGINFKTRKTFQNTAALVTGDMRHAGTVGRSRIGESKLELAKEQIEKYPAWNTKEYRSWIIKQAKAKYKGNKELSKQYNKKIRNHLKSFIENIGLYKSGGTLKYYTGGIAPKRVDMVAFASDSSNNRNRAINVEDMEVLQDSLIARKYNLPQRLAILSTAAQETDERGFQTQGVGGNGYGGVSKQRMPVQLLKDRGKQITWYLNDLSKTHSDNWLDGGSGGPTIMSGKNGFNKFWNSNNVREATIILNKSYTRPRDREEAWNNRAEVAKTMQKYLK